MKKFSVLIVLSALAVAGLSALDADEIVLKAKDRVNASTTSVRSSMIITAKDGSTTERLVDQYSAKTNGLQKAVIVFQKPANVANTRFLVIENAGRAEDRWIYLPSLGKTRRIAGSEGSGSFVGTDFSYDDISSAGRDVEKDSHKLLREEPLSGEDCYVIESAAKDAAFQYSKTVRWISKDTFITLKAELYDRKGDLVKLLEIGKIETIQGIPTPMTTKMTSVRAGTSTTINIQIMKYNDKIPDSVFTERYLTTGRP